MRQNQFMDFFKIKNQPNPDSSKKWPDLGLGSGRSLVFGCIFEKKNRELYYKLYVNLKNQLNQLVLTSVQFLILLFIVFRILTLSYIMYILLFILTNKKSFMQLSFNLQNFKFFFLTVSNFFLLYTLFYEFFEKIDCK